jgi:hypothetical protein
MEKKLKVILKEKEKESRSENAAVEERGKN